MRIDWNKKYTTISIYAVIVFIICLIIYKLTDSWSDTKTFFSNVKSVFFPFLLGMLIAYFMNFIVSALEKRVLPLIKPLKSKTITRLLSIFLSYITVFALIVLMLTFILPQLIGSLLQLINEFPDYISRLIAYFDSLTFNINGSIYYFDPNNVDTFLSEQLPNNVDQLSTMVTELVPNLIRITKNFAFGLLNVFIAIIISIYLLNSKESSTEKSKKAIVSIFPQKTACSILGVLAYSHTVFSRFFIGTLLDALIIGILCFIILLIVKMPFAILISSLITLTNLIPYFGPFIGGGIGFAFLLIVNPVKAVWFLVIIFLLQQFDGNILGPKILGGSIGLSPFWIIFSILLFGNIFGFIGMLFGAPFFSIIKTLIEGYLDNRYNKKMNTTKH
ncbi:MAG: AI-2E family transporter [Firmicutes bacterium HGW-Firmicutes-1]|jgi:predicted PurR-regulated permease PerM|nr:MAG: AI-2E family transporter [Firmicutes bacterium HGW-Firmicutes-1]